MTDKPNEPGRGRPRRRPNLDEVFGDVLPTTTSDEREPDQPNAERDAWYERNRPPHHDRD